MTVPPQQPQRHRWWPAVIAALLGAEYLSLTLLFDAAALADAGGAGNTAAQLGRIGPLLLAIPAAALLLGKQRIVASWRQAPAHRPRNGALLLVAHLAAFALFAVLTERLIASAPPSALAIAVWLTAALAWLLLGLFAALPPRAVVGIARAGSRPLALGAGVGLAAWGAGYLTERLYEPMAAATLRTTYALLHLFTDRVEVDTSSRILSTDRFWVEIAPDCAGYEGIGVVAVFLIAFLYASRSKLRFPHALALLPLSIVAVWLLNAVRLALLVVVGDRLSPELALAGFHSKAGWIAVCAVALTAAFAARRSRWFALDPEPADEVDNPTAAYLVPLLAMIAAAMVTGALALGVDLLYGVRLVAAGGALWLYRRALGDELGPAAWSWSGAAVGALIGAAVFAVWLALEPAADPDAVATARGELAAAGPLGVLYRITRTLGSVLIVPVVEELAFRGFLLRRLVDRDFTEVDRRRFAPLAFLVSSLAFGLLHQRWLAGTLAGMAFAAAYQRRGRLSDAVVAHAVANALIAVAVLGFDRWELWL